MTEPLLPERLARAITLAGPIPLSQYMGAANAHYYATRDPLGARGDFTTAPEVSQMFGELIGLWLADLWDRAGRPQARYVELGPGRGTLAADALRAMRTIGFAPPVHFVETSPDAPRRSGRAGPRRRMEPRPGRRRGRSAAARRRQRILRRAADPAIDSDRRGLARTARCLPGHPVSAGRRGPRLRPGRFRTICAAPSPDRSSRPRPPRSRSCARSPSGCSRRAAPR